MLRSLSFSSTLPFGLTNTNKLYRKPISLSSRKFCWLNFCVSDIYKRFAKIEKRDEMRRNETGNEMRSNQVRPNERAMKSGEWECMNGMRSDKTRRAQMRMR